MLLLVLLAPVLGLLLVLTLDRWEAAVFGGKPARTAASRPTTLREGATEPKQHGTAHARVPRVQRGTCRGSARLPTAMHRYDVRDVDVSALTGNRACHRPPWDTRPRTRRRRSGRTGQSGSACRARRG